MPVVGVAAAGLDLHELVEVQDGRALRRGLAVAGEVGAGRFLLRFRVHVACKCTDRTAPKA